MRNRRRARAARRRSTASRRPEPSSARSRTGRRRRPSRSVSRTTRTRSRTRRLRPSRSQRAAVDRDQRRRERRRGLALQPDPGRGHRPGHGHGHELRRALGRRQHRHLRAPTAPRRTPTPTAPADHASPSTSSTRTAPSSTAANALSVHVNNVAPSIAISGAANVNEGSPYSLTLGAVSDPGTDTVSSYVVHWGDGNTDTYSTATAPRRTPTPTARRPRDHRRPGRRGRHPPEPGERALGDRLQRRPDVVTAPANQTASEGTSVTFDLGSFTDPGDDDPWEVTVDWGDGSPDTVFNEATPGAIADKTHTYADDGTFTVTVTVDEDAGAGVSRLGHLPGHGRQRPACRDRSRNQTASEGTATSSSRSAASPTRATTIRGRSRSTGATARATPSSTSLPRARSRPRRTPTPTTAPSPSPSRWTRTSAPASADSRHLPGDGRQRPAGRHAAGRPDGERGHAASFRARLASPIPATTIPGGHGRLGRRLARHRLQRARAGPDRGQDPHLRRRRHLHGHGHGRGGQRHGRERLRHLPGCRRQRRSRRDRSRRSNGGRSNLEVVRPGLLHRSR